MSASVLSLPRMLMDCRASRAPSHGAAANDSPSLSPLGRSQALGFRWGRTCSRKRIVEAAATSALLPQSAFTACEGITPELERDPSLSFVCERSTSFCVNFFDGQIRVTTSTSADDLDLSRSSIGTKYSSGDTTFILDEDLAVLTGEDGGHRVQGIAQCNDRTA